MMGSSSLSEPPPRSEPEPKAGAQSAPVHERPPWKHAASRLKSLFISLAKVLRREWRVWIPLVLIAAFGFLVRFSAEQAHPGPSGADYGNYLTNVAILWGHDVTGAGLQYPPLYLCYLSLLLLVFPTLTALQISGPLLASILTFPGYRLVRLYADERPALVGAAVISLADPFSELMGWGGGPQIFATIFIILFFYWGVRALENGARKHAILAGLALSAVAGGHQLSLLYVLLLAVLAGAGLPLVLRHKAWPYVRTGMTIVGFGILFSLPYAALYVALASRLQPFAPPNLVTPDASSVVSNSAFVLSYGILWLPLILVAAFSYARTLRRAPVRSLVGVVLLLGPFLLALTIFAYHPARPLYEVPIGVAPGLAMFIDSIGKSESRWTHGNTTLMRVSAVTIALIAVSGVAYASQARIKTAESYYYILGPGVLDGLAWLRDNTSVGSKVITDGPPRYGLDELNGYQWAWWIQGYASRMAYGTGSTQLQTYTDWAAQSDLANTYFAGRYVGESAYWRIGENGPAAAIGNPTLFGQYTAGFKGAALFDDSAILLNVSGVRASPFGWPVGSFSETLAAGTLEMKVTRSAAGATFERSSLLTDGAPEVTVRINMSGPVTTALVPLFSTSNAIISSISGPDGGVDIQAAGDVGDTNQISMRIETRNATLREATPLGGKVPAYRVDFLFQTSSNSSSISFTFDLLSPNRRGQSGLRWIDTSTLIELAGIQYVFVSPERARDLNRFGSDPKYQTAYRNTEIIVFYLVSGLGALAGFR